MSKLRDIDYGWLRSLKGLLWLSIPHSGFSDLTLLEGMDRLEWLGLNDSQISDLSPLTRLPALKMFFYGDSPVSDVTPLQQIPGYAGSTTNVAGGTFRGGVLSHMAFRFD